MMKRTAVLTLAVLLAASVAAAQDWRGRGRITGKVVDEQGKPLEGVVVQATFPEVMGAAVQAKSDKRGEWSVDDVAAGGWKLAFEKEGYDPGTASADVDDDGYSRPVRTTLKKTFDPNAFIQSEGARAAALLEQRKYADARAIYEGIIKRVPQVKDPMQYNLALTYYLENVPAKTIEHLKAGLATDAGNVRMKVMLSSALLQTNALDEAVAVANTLSDADVTEPQFYVNFGVAFASKPDVPTAMKYLEKAIQRFPQAANAYYTRAGILIPLINAEKDPKNAERIERLERVKTDLKKFLELTPNAPEAAQVKKLLAELEK